MRNKKLRLKPLLRMLAISLFFAVLTIVAVIVYSTQPWDGQIKGSAALAEKPEYYFSHEYIAYGVIGY